MDINQQFVQTLLIAIVPILGTLLPGVLKRDSFPPAVNSIIAGLVIVLASGGTAYAQDKLGPDFAKDAFVVGALIAASLAGPLKSLDQFLQSNILPSKPAPTSVIPSIRRSSVITKATGNQVQPGQWMQKDDSQSG